MKLIDLFAGAGGLSEGFYQAGFTIQASIDNNPHCINTLKSRALFRYYHSIGREKEYFSIIKDRDIKDRLEIFDFLSSEKKISEKIESIDLSNTYDTKVLKSIKKIGIKPDLIVGGPPCQAYSLMNTRARKNAKDSRHVLFKNYLHIIDQLKPKMFLFENVVGMTSTIIDGKNIIQLFENDLKKMKTQYTIISKMDGTLFSNLSYNRKDYIYNMSSYGLPQNRKRFILIAVRNDIYNKINVDLLSDKIFNTPSNEMNTVKDAIHDLPKLFLKTNRGEDIFLNKKSDKKKMSQYASSLMNTEIKGTFNHKARTQMKEDLARYKYLAKLPKDERASNTLQLLKHKMPKLLPNHKNLSSFVDRFKVQYKENISSTVMAHISKDGHYYIHYDPEQNRSLTVREAARLQGFPDDYFFEGPRTEQFKMVGNAVPPFFTKQLAENILEIFN